MDDAGVRSYVGRVKLLLLLSALLSALTGVQAGARAPRAAVAVSQVAVLSAPLRSASVALGGRPSLILPTLADRARAAIAPVWRLAVVVPLYASRRRE